MAFFSLSRLLVPDDDNNREDAFAADVQNGATGASTSPRTARRTSADFPTRGPP